jgi:hypothetical protein
LLGYNWKARKCRRPAQSFWNFIKNKNFYKRWKCKYKTIEVAALYYTNNELIIIFKLKARVCDEGLYEKCANHIKLSENNEGVKYFE